MDTKNKIATLKRFSFLRKERVLALLMFFFVTTGIAANNSPVLNCATVLSNGDVQLNWIDPINTGAFDSYHIYFSNTSAGPFSVLDSVFVANQTSYTHIAAGANVAPVYYFIQTRDFGAGYSPVIDTVQTIQLSVINPSDGTALLAWNPKKSDTSSIYNVFHEYPTGVWTEIATLQNTAGSSTNLNYTDSIIICNSQVNYRVEISDSAGCISQSSVSGDVFQNIIVPDTPMFDTMSVDSSNNALMSWVATNNIDVEGYVIYRFNGTSFIPVDSILGKDNTSYNYLSSTADVAPEQYRLAAYDSCGNISQLGSVFNTIHLSATADICKRSAILSWTAYSTFSDGLSEYKIFQSSTGPTGSYTLIDSVTDGTLTYTATGLLPNTMYHFKIQAINTSEIKTASSNWISFYSATPIFPSFLYIQNVSVQGLGQVNLTCHVDVSSPSLNFKVMRSTDTASNTFVHIGTVSSTGSSPILYADNTVLTNSSSYYYKVINVDSCGLDGMESNLARTILLTIESDNELKTNRLLWNDYELWDGGVDSYNIYRGVDGTVAPTPIANIPFSFAGTNEYTDEISQILEGQGVFSYYVEAVEGAGSQFSFNDSSSSNYVEAYQEPKIFLPNVFSPNGNRLNEKFKPVTLFVSLSGYEIRVFNRMGLEMYYSNDLYEGWNGRYKGQLCPLGVYVYMIRYKSARGEYIDIKGSVTLLR